MELLLLFIVASLSTPVNVQGLNSSELWLLGAPGPEGWHGSARHAAWTRRRKRLAGSPSGAARHPSGVRPERGGVDVHRRSRAYIAIAKLDERAASPLYCGAVVGVGFS